MLSEECLGSKYSLVQYYQEKYKILEVIWFYSYEL